MMHKIIINKLGPIEHIELICNEFMVITGPQASGKSTIAKAVFFFRTVKDNLLSLMLKKASDNNRYREMTLNEMAENELLGKFAHVFGKSLSLDNDVSIIYHYNDDTYIGISAAEMPDTMVDQVRIFLATIY